MEYIEANPLPECCQNCTEPDEGCCDECDHLGERFVLSKDDQKKMDNLIEQRIKGQSARIAITPDNLHD